MKKGLALILTAVLALSMAACGGKKEDKAAEADVKGEGVMTYEEYIAADMDTEVVIETYVQAKQSW